MAAEILQPFVCGGTAACLASTAIHPIDLSKVRLQLFATLNPGVPKPSFIDILSKLAKDEGVSALYAGLSASLMRQAVYGTARIGLFRSFSDKLSERNNGGKLSFAEKTLAGMGSGMIAVCIGTPFDVALVRMQGDSMKSPKDRRGYKNVFDALKRVTAEEGFAKLYSGLAANVLRGASMNVGMLACYDHAKEFIGHSIMNESSSATPSTTTQLGASLIAGFTASSFSLPFDLLKSRLQDGAKYKGLGDAVYQIFTKEGPFAFWTGFGAYYMRTAPHSMIILISSESITQVYRSFFVNK